MATKRIFYYAQADLWIDTMASRGPGDSDVDTKSGRQTKVSVTTSNPDLKPGVNAFTIHVEYSIAEGHKDNTYLFETREVLIQLPSGYQFAAFGPGFQQANFHKSIGGRHHEWMDITNETGIAGTYLDKCSIKIDGEGDDDQGNAQLHAHFMVPLLVNVIEEPLTNSETVGAGGVFKPQNIPGILTSQIPANAKEAKALAAKVRGLGPVLYSVSKQPGNSTHLSPR